ncbi:MAG: ABC transporter ATP-binding protein [Zoogloea sp.]|nr:ABC transporter ATP-binding protein [Zoogloea sp.]
MLQVRGLHYRYPAATTQALVDFSLEARRGEILGLLGPNGAGKSTLVAHLAGLLQPAAGQIEVDGEALAELRRRAPGSIAIAPQDFAFYPMLSVAENLRCFAAASRLSGTEARQAIARTLAATRMEDFAGTRAEHLSGGLKRRLNLAIALLPTPELLVLDEPTVGVDPQSRAFLLDTVRALAASGMAVIYASHYMEEIEAIADRVVIVDHGRVLRQGSLTELLAQARGQVELQLEAPLDAEALAALAGEIDGRLEAAGVYLKLELAAEASPVAAMASIEARGGCIRDARFGRHSLEHLFMSLTDTRLRDE